MFFFFMKSYDMWISVKVLEVFDHTAQSLCFIQNLQAIAFPWYVIMDQVSSTTGFKSCVCEQCSHFICASWIRKSEFEQICFWVIRQMIVECIAEDNL